MPHTTHVLGIVALSPERAVQHMIAALNWGMSPVASAQPAAPLPIRGGWIPSMPAARANAVMAASPVAPHPIPIHPGAPVSATTYLIWDGEDILVEMGGNNSGGEN